jgi:hypothetical protein
MNNPLETDTTIGIATTLHPYIIMNTKKLVYRTGTAQRRCKLERFATGLCNHVFI